MHVSHGVKFDDTAKSSMVSDESRCVIVQDCLLVVVPRICRTTICP